MSNKNEVAVRIDKKGRVTLPKSIRDALGLETGDTVFLRFDPKKGRLLLAPVANPFKTMDESVSMYHLEDHTKISAETEDRVWLEADFDGLPPFDWGEKGPPKGKPVQYNPGVGLIVKRGKL